MRLHGHNMVARCMCIAVGRCIVVVASIVGEWLSVEEARSQCVTMDIVIWHVDVETYVLD